MSDPSRREFIKLGAAFAAAAGASGLSDAIQRARAITPVPGSSYLDAEHVIILMQENRSFDHAYGTLRGVRGFDDPRAITLADGNPVWVQTNDAGESFAPFRLNLLDSKATWMGSLPHGWTDQVDARNGGRHDCWLQAKRSDEPAYADLPLTLGYYNRSDIPFYYDLADAFTICDQHFCSSLTGTTPNRSYLWSGTIRAEASENSQAHLFNSEMDYGAEVSWRTFPELLEDHGVSWKVYQNELYLDVGFEGEEGPWLSNFGDNPLEYFTQYHPRFIASHRRAIDARIESLEGEIAALKRRAAAETVAAKMRATVELVEKVATLARAKAARAQWSEAKFAKLSPREQALHTKAFCTNTGDPHYHELEQITYQDNGVERTVEAAKGDVLHQFRRDVETGQLPAVSWIVAPERFSDHPSSAWYGAWYIAEVLDILTQRPEVWRKTIFILTYDENDGYFDHVPPFVAPHPRRPETGRVSLGIDASVEYVDGEFEAKRREAQHVRDSPIGLGYRVPLVIASPWSRGGAVCSQVFDHTSPVQFLEKLLSNKLGRELKEINISAWRRVVCGDLTSAFQTADSIPLTAPSFQDRDAFIGQIHRAQFKDLPRSHEPLSEQELDQICRDQTASPRLPRQEPGTRPSLPLPYQISADGRLRADHKSFEIRFASAAEAFGVNSAGAPFIVYSTPGANAMQIRNYAVAPGEEVSDAWPLADFAEGRYHLAVHGPNGFFREFQGSDADPPLEVRFNDVRIAATNNFVADRYKLMIANRNAKSPLTIFVEDLSYGTPKQRREMAPSEKSTFTLDLGRSHGWYDFRVQVPGTPYFAWRFAGRVETGLMGSSDPAIGSPPR
jgi:phospholipase C